MTRAARIVGTAIVAPTLALALGLALALPAVAAVARAAAQANVVEATGVRVNWPMAMPTVQGGASGASFVGNMPSMGMAMMLMPRNSGLMVRREDATGAPVTAPNSFQVVGNQGDGALIVKTGANAEIRIGQDGAIAGGALVGGSAASIAVARGVAMRVGDRGTGPVSTDTLVIVVQYN
ncbi:MAG: hypothetical protein JF588_13315 [Caulobacterales bacterium]|nr:hypothetical protein [Caulobacterales bacterium]